jgi:glutathione synthase/RimK-type ligase-like ATP-grasp enzyme
MKRIAVLFGMEETFPPALIERINSLKVRDVSAEMLKTGGVVMAQPSGYRVIIDRISQDVPFYRALLKNAVLNGTIVLNNPFWWSADDKFFNYALASRIGVATPRTVLLPHKQHPPDTTERSMRNMIYPLDWDQIFSYIGWPAFLKPHAGGGWKHVYKVHDREEFFLAYDQTGDLCMTLQEAIEFESYYRCYVIGQEQVRVMRYEPRAPHAERYAKEPAPVGTPLYERIVGDAQKLCRALGYDINTVEFAVRGGIPYAIDFLNPAPDADYHSVGAESFDWVVNAVAELAVRAAQSEANPAAELRWAPLLRGVQLRASAGSR